MGHQCNLDIIQSSIAIEVETFWHKLAGRNPRPDQVRGGAAWDLAGEMCLKRQGRNLIDMAGGDLPTPSRTRLRYCMSVTSGLRVPGVYFIRVYAGAVKIRILRITIEERLPSEILSVCSSKIF